jgi:hypothetical protein
MAKDFFEYHRTRDMVDYHYLGKTRNVHCTIEQEKAEASESQDATEDKAQVEHEHGMAHGMAQINVVKRKRKKNKLSLNTNIRQNFQDFVALENAGLTFPSGDGFEKTKVKDGFQSSSDLCTERLKGGIISSTLSVSSSFMSNVVADKEHWYEQDEGSSPFNTTCESDTCHFSSTLNTSFETGMSHMSSPSCRISAGEETYSPVLRGLSSPSPLPTRKRRAMEIYRSNGGFRRKHIICDEEIESNETEVYANKPLKIKTETLYTEKVRELKDSFILEDDSKVSWHNPVTPN